MDHALANGIAESDLVVVGGCAGVLLLGRDELASYVRGGMWAPVCGLLVALIYTGLLFVF